MLLLLACSMPRADLSTTALDAPPADPWAELESPGPLTHQVFVSAYGSTKLSGLVNLDNPGAAELEDHPIRIALPVHALTHPEHGSVVIDTGLARKLQVRGPARIAMQSLDEVIPLGDIFEQIGEPSAVFLTHMHADHVLGLPDVPQGTPIYVGPGEWDVRGNGLGLLRRSYKATWKGHTFQVLDFPEAKGGFNGVVDVWGDGSLYVLHTPGHTPGSISLVARTTEGSMLFTGDTCHTLWGWEHGVEPGDFTEDHQTNARNLEALRALAQAHDLKVWVGHETDGEGTGID